MIDWTKPIETVPYERNSEPVPCVFLRFDSDGDAEVAVGEAWDSDRDILLPDGCGWFYLSDTGTPGVSWLPNLRNVSPLTQG